MKNYLTNMPSFLLACGLSMLTLSFSYGAYANIYLSAYGGYGVVDGAYKETGQVAQARLALGVLTKNCGYGQYGAELGVQSGDSISYQARQELIETAGGLPLSSVIKPWVDLLAVAKFSLASCGCGNFFGLVKAGIAYRQTQYVVRSSAHDNFGKINPELQVGLGYNITRCVSLALLYQGIYSKNNAGAYLDVNEDVLLRNIPTQQAGLLGIEYIF